MVPSKRAVALSVPSARVWAAVPVCDLLDPTTLIANCGDPGPKRSETLPRRCGAFRRTTSTVHRGACWESTHAPLEGDYASTGHAHDQPKLIPSPAWHLHRNHTRHRMFPSNRWSLALRPRSPRLRVDRMLAPDSQEAAEGTLAARHRPVAPNECDDSESAHAPQQPRDDLT